MNIPVRYDLVKINCGYDGHDHVMEPCEDGEWVRWEEADIAIRDAKLDTVRALIPEIVKPQNPYREGRWDGTSSEVEMDDRFHGWNAGFPGGGLIRSCRSAAYEEGLQAGILARKNYTPKPKFDNVSCSQCQRSFGPGEHGFSHCENHKGMAGTR